VFQQPRKVTTTMLWINRRLWLSAAEKFDQGNLGDAVSRNELQTLAERMAWLRTSRCWGQPARDGAN